jgi:hypothetical protein
MKKETFFVWQNHLNLIVAIRSLSLTSLILYTFFPTAKTTSRLRLRGPPGPKIFDLLYAKIQKEAAYMFYQWAN